MLPTCQNASIIMIMAEITSGDMKKSVEDQEARHHCHCRTLVLQVVEGDRLKYERVRHEIEIVQIYLYEATYIICWNFTITTRKTRRRLTRRRISPMQNKDQVMVTEKIEAKIGDTGPESSLTIATKL